LVRGAAVWALKQIGDQKLLMKTKKHHLEFENEGSVIDEWGT
jgi:hypothetical protein